MKTPRTLPAAISRRLVSLFPLPCLLLGGCVALPGWGWFKGPPAPPGPVDSLVLRGDHLESETAPVTAKPGTTDGDMEGAKELFRRGEYATAEKVFHRIAENSKNIQLAEEARYYEAESLRLQGYYPKAADTYSRLLKDFTSGQFRDQANQRLFDIANYWFDDTRSIMEEYKQQHEGKRWFVWPVSWVHWDKTKPLLDEEGWAVEKMEEIKTDITGPLADKALFYLGSVKFFRRDYHEADQNFSQLAEMHPNSPLAPQALKMAIICKQLVTGGSDYDGRKTAEARQLVDSALRSYPELAQKEHDFLARQVYCINQQQADKDLKIAEYYRRTGHPGSAYFYYEIVIRRYPGTSYCEKATQRKKELEAEMAQAKKKAPLFSFLPGFGSAEKDKAPAPAESTAPAPPVTPLPRPETAPPPRPLPLDMAGTR
jgi:TolA-binding protein